MAVFQHTTGKDRFGKRYAVTRASVAGDRFLHSDSCAMKRFSELDN